MSFSVGCWVKPIIMYYWVPYKQASNQAKLSAGKFEKKLTGGEYELAKFTAHPDI